MISGLAYKASKGKADELTTATTLKAAPGDQPESHRHATGAGASQSRRGATLAELKQKQLDALKVRAGIDGVLVDLPLQVGQHVSPGAMLAKVVQPESSDGGIENRRDPGAGCAIGEPAQSTRITESSAAR